MIVVFSALCSSRYGRATSTTSVSNGRNFALELLRDPRTTYEFLTHLALMAISAETT
jgi:hypothetical protein